MVRSLAARLPKARDRLPHLGLPHRLAARHRPLQPGEKPGEGGAVLLVAEAEARQLGLVLAGLRAAQPPPFATNACIT